MVNIFYYVAIVFCFIVLFNFVWSIIIKFKTRKDCEKGL